jgi:hypothetical protein
MGAYSVIKINDRLNKETCLYEYIETLEEAGLLAQLAMCNKHPWDELIYITPGWNRSIDKNCPEEYIKALQLAEKYSSDR